MNTVTNLGYLVAAVLFILGLKGMTSPRTAVRGNKLGATAMAIAIISALLENSVMTYWWILIGIAIGGGIGYVWSKRVPMTSMPEMVAALNGFGGGASLLVALASYIESQNIHLFEMSADWSIALIASVLVGAVTLTGSFVAVGKLMGKVQDAKNIRTYKMLVKVCAVLVLLGTIYFVVNPGEAYLLIAVLGIICLVLGVLLVMPIGGADMPVVISLLNSYSGIAGAATGFVLGNNGLIITGSLVGASGIILTSIMCKAMNRSLTNVLFGGSISEQGSGSKTEGDEFYEGKVKQAGPEELAMILDTATSVIFVPGYGLAVAQAHHATRELANLLEKRGVKVKYAIHPVAGRMPGHMNVLLAEAEVPYDQLVEMDHINPEFPHTDVAIVLGANDVTNPSASDDPASPIYGMPILEVHNAKTVAVIKRSLSPGFAGIPNKLFINDNTLMVFGDAKEMQQKTITALQEM